MTPTNDISKLFTIFVMFFGKKELKVFNTTEQYIFLVYVYIGILYVMSSIIEWIYGLFQVVANRILPDKICGVTPGHYRVVFYASVAIVISILIVGIGSMMAMEDLDFVSAFYFSTQTSVVRI